MKDLGVMVFAHTRATLLGEMLESLKQQKALKYVDLWVDGYQGVVSTRLKVEKTHKVADNYDVAVRRYHKGGLGFRKMILQAMQSAIHNYKYIIMLEDDCFPTRDAIEIFSRELKLIEDRDDIFSVYGHPFLMAEEGGLCSRFQGWGWATTSKKLAPYVDELIRLYSMPEQHYLDEVSRTLTPELLSRLDVTPPRLPSHTLRSFYAWDETLAMLTARDGMTHKLTDKRVIYNCGMGKDASRFSGENKFLKPPFNIVDPETVWDYF